MENANEVNGVDEDQVSERQGPDTQRGMSTDRIQVIDLGEASTKNGSDSPRDDVRQPKKRRLDPEQAKKLDKHFAMNNKLDARRKQILSDDLNLDARQIEVWFQNRRARNKAKKVEEDSNNLKDQLAHQHDMLQQLQEEKHKYVAEYQQMQGTLLKAEQAWKQLESALKYQTCLQECCVVFGRAAFHARTFAELFSIAVARILQVTMVEVVSILEFIPSGSLSREEEFVHGDLLLRAGYGWKPEQLNSLRFSPGKTSHFGYTFATGEPQMTSNLGLDGNFTDAFLTESMGMRSGATVQIFTNGRPYGVLGIHSSLYRTFTHEDGLFLQTMANVIGSQMSKSLADKDEDA